MAHKVYRYPELFSSAPAVYVFNASYTAGTMTVVLKSSPGSGAIGQYLYPNLTAVGSKITNVSGNTVTLATGLSVSVTSNATTIIGNPIAVSAGLNTVYLRASASVYAGDALYFSTAAGVVDNHKIQTLTASATNNMVVFTPAVPAGSPSIGATTVYAGGFPAPLTDNISLGNAATANNKLPRTQADTLTFGDAITAGKIFTKALSDSIALANAIVNQLVAPRWLADFITLSDTTTGHSPKANINVTDSFTIGGAVTNFHILSVMVNDAFGYSDFAATPRFLFSTPITKVVPPILPDSRGASYLLFRHYEIRERNVNVFLLKDGTLVQDYPTPENGNTNVPYPWNPNDPTALVSYVHNWDGSISEYHLPNPIVKVFWGGEKTPVDATLANKLRQNGYANYLEAVY